MEIKNVHELQKEYEDFITLSELPDSHDLLLQREADRIQKFLNKKLEEKAEEILAG